jgi:hypothetical protein
VAQCHEKRPPEQATTEPAVEPAAPDRETETETETELATSTETERHSEAPRPAPSTSKPQQERRYKCISRAALTKRKGGPKFDEATGRPAAGEIVGFVNAGELITVLEDDVLLSLAGVPQRLFVQGRGGWVSIFAQDGTKLLEELAPQKLSAVTVGGSSADKVPRGSYEYDEIGAAPLDRSSLDVHLDPLGLGDAPPSSSRSSSTDRRPGNEAGAADSSAEGDAAERLYASVSAGRYRAMFDFEPEQDTDLRLTTGGVVLLLNKTHEHWWEGANETDPSAVGMFPFNYVQPLMIVRACWQLPAGDEITVSLPPALCPLAEDGSIQTGVKLQVLLPHGANAGQEIEFPLPFDFDTSRIESESQPSGEIQRDTEKGQRGAGTRFGITKGGNQVPAGTTPPVVDMKTRRRRELEAEKVLMYRRIEGELSKALNAADAKALVRSNAYVHCNRLCSSLCVFVFGGDD